MVSLWASISSEGGFVFPGEVTGFIVFLEWVVIEFEEATRLTVVTEEDRLSRRSPYGPVFENSDGGDAAERLVFVLLVAFQTEHGDAPKADGA